MKIDWKASRPTSSWGVMQATFVQMTLAAHSMQGFERCFGRSKHVLGSTPRQGSIGLSMRNFDPNNSRSSLHNTYSPIVSQNRAQLHSMRLSARAFWKKTQQRSLHNTSSVCFGRSGSEEWIHIVALIAFDSQQARSAPCREFLVHSGSRQTAIARIFEAFVVIRLTPLPSPPHSSTNGCFEEISRRTKSPSGRLRAFCSHGSHRPPHECDQ
jgi:hypothetical protein